MILPDKQSKTMVSRFSAPFIVQRSPLSKCASKMPDAQSDLKAASGHQMRRNSKNGVTRQRSYFALEQVSMNRSYQIIQYPLHS